MRRMSRLVTSFDGGNPIHVYNYDVEKKESIYSNNLESSYSHKLVGTFPDELWVYDVDLLEAFDNVMLALKNAKKMKKEAAVILRLIGSYPAIVDHVCECRKGGNDDRENVAVLASDIASGSGQRTGVSDKNIYRLEPPPAVYEMAKVVQGYLSPNRRCEINSYRLLPVQMLERQCRMAIALLAAFIEMGIIPEEKTKKRHEKQSTGTVISSVSNLIGNIREAIVSVDGKYNKGETIYFSYKGIRTYNKEVIYAAWHHQFINSETGEPYDLHPDTLRTCKFSVTLGQLPPRPVPHESRQRSRSRASVKDMRSHSKSRHCSKSPLDLAEAAAHEYEEVGNVKSGYSTQRSRSRASVKDMRSHSKSRHCSKSPLDFAEAAAHEYEEVGNVKSGYSTPSSDEDEDVFWAKCGKCPLGGICTCDGSGDQRKYRSKWDAKKRRILELREYAGTYSHVQDVIYDSSQLNQKSAESYKILGDITDILSKLSVIEQTDAFGVKGVTAYIDNLDLDCKN